jgi:hypothetical protein
MKTLIILHIKKMRTVVTILFLSLILCGMASCEITRHTENGEHRGWFHRHNDNREKRGTVIIISPQNQNNRERQEQHDNN